MLSQGKVRANRRSSESWDKEKDSWRSGLETKGPSRSASLEKRHGLIDDLW